MPDPSRDELIRIFREHGVSGEIREVVPRAGDEAVFVVTSIGSANMRERELTVALQSALHRKVWVTTEGGSWTGDVRPL